MENEQRKLGGLENSIKNIDKGIERIESKQDALIEGNNKIHIRILSNIADHEARIANTEKSVGSLWKSNTKIIIGVVSLLVTIIGAIIGGLLN